MRYKYFKVILTTILSSLVIGFVQPAKAESLSLAIDPTLIEITAIPPTTATSSLNIQNKSDTPISLQIQFRLFRAKGENGELEYLKEAPQIFKNIQILDAGMPINNLTLGPQQQKSLSLNINIPQDMTPSDYYFSIQFISTNSSSVKSNSSVNQIGIVANVLLSIGPAELPKATLEEFSSKIFFQSGPVPFAVKVKNNGTHIIKPKGVITVKNMFGQAIGKLELKSVNILSNSTRAVPNTLYLQELRLKNKSTTQTNYLDFKKPIALWKENFLLGFYTADIEISMSDAGPTFKRAIHFLAFPLQILIIIILVIAAAIVFRKRLKFYANKSRT